MILCCGEALIDMLPRVTPAGEAAYAPYAGGAVFNTAIALGRLGARTGFFSGLSADFFGDLLRAQLSDSQVDASLAIIADRPCTIAYVKLVDGHATYAFYDENTAGRMLTPADLPPIPETVSALFFGGISLPVEPCGEAYEALMLREAATRVTMIDPNIRPGFIRDEARYRARIERMLGVADIVKLSDEDLHWLRGAGDIDTLAKDILAQGAKLVCITEGAQGVRGFHAGGVVKVASTRVEVVDTVGAGDTFNAGLLAELDRRGKLDKAAITTLTQDDITAALGFGARAAAVTVSRAGANPPWARELA
ncbi:2-dehydro-3-deoxygluconokinase [Aquimixticola soesokkakensis]|uniref:2-dehydro-3-deoxygluconokinase n=1 Tax=Aquimixticola soesokkakensis TaxID=1519096 RepID=A0A1Y5TA04_9RHOB|nr:carbohydrate kinase [Aquimixticola soesokkakensis]SLN59037.1 2-dehydro-3-deoxygluconokinase [Aquimixticola soesokkakensis]